MYDFILGAVILFTALYYLNKLDKVENRLTLLEDDAWRRRTASEENTVDIMNLEGEVDSLKKSSK